MATGTYAAETPRGREEQPRRLIVTIFGLYARAELNWLSVASVVRLMADLGVDGSAVRSSVSRLKRRGVLRSERHGGAAGYALSEPTLEMLAEGDIRIFERERAEVGDGWILVVFSIPESERDKRHALRSTLTRLGFGTVSPGVWIGPGNLIREVRHTLERRALASYVDIFRGDHLAFGDLRAKVRGWWNFDELNALYADFLHRHRPTLHRVTKAKPAPGEAFTRYVPLLTEWRRLPYRDPGLPLSLLPAGWKGEAAGELFDELNRVLSGPAREHAMAVIHG
ncbi:PaaX family transcriptional regulator [Amycolatopsis sacchari]|uniref:PaaX family transcriptional regulator n=1 Tax=Amycolatopsis sacchari TaxID=115433 RepID=UPI003D73AFC4